MIDNYAKDKLTLMIHTQFGGRINFAINSDNKFQLDPVSKGSSFLLEEAQDIFECFSDRAAQMARLDNLGDEVAPAKPGFLEGIFHPSRVREYKAKQAEWKSQVHGQDHDSDLGSVELQSGTNDGKLDASMTYDPSQEGRYGGIAPESLEYHREFSYLYDDGSDAAGVMGPSRVRNKLDCTMTREGTKDPLQVRLDNGFVGLRTLTVDWASGTGELLGQVSRSDQGEFYLPSLDKNSHRNSAPKSKPQSALRKRREESKPEKSWAERQANSAYDNAGWKQRQRLDRKAGGSYRDTVANLKNLPWRQRQKMERKLGL